MKLTFGIHNWIVESKTSRFYEKLKEGKIEATRCIKCDEIYYPPRSDCPLCYDSGIQWFEIKSREGTLKTFTTITVSPTEFADFMPYCVGILDLPEGVSIMGWIKDASEDLMVGDKFQINLEQKAGRTMIWFSKQFE